MGFIIMLALLSLIPLLIIQTVNWFFTKKKEILNISLICGVLQLCVCFILFAILSTSELANSRDTSGGGYAVLPFFIGIFVVTVMSGLFLYPLATNIETKKSSLKKSFVVFLIYLLSIVGILVYFLNT